MNSLSQAAVLLLRDIYRGRLNLLLLSLILAIGTITSVSIFVERIRNTILTEAGSFLAADRQIRSTVPIPEIWIDTAAEQSLDTAQIISFSSMVFAEQEMSLGYVKAVSDYYPLRGILRISEVPWGEAREVKQGPVPGEVWLASRLFAKLQVQPGDKLWVGEKALTVTAALISEPDSGQAFFGTGPRVLMHMDDVAAAGVIQPGSRVEYRFLLRGNTTALEKFYAQVAPSFDNRSRWLDVRDGNVGLSGALERGERFLLLAGCLAVILAAVATILAANYYTDQQKNSIAVLKTLGLTPSRLKQWLLVQLLILLGLSICGGLIVGELAHRGIVWLLQDSLPKELAAASIWAYGQGIITGTLLVIALILPPWLHLVSTAPMAVLRPVGTQHQGTLLRIVLAGVALLLLLQNYSRNWQISLALALGGAVALILAAIILRYSLVNLSYKIRAIGQAWRIGLANIKRRRWGNSLQILVFGLTLMMLSVLTQVRTSLVNEWQQELPADTPNHFVYNLYGDQLDVFKHWVREHHLQTTPYYPITRARINRINEKKLEDIIAVESPRSNDFTRELNLTWAAEPGKDNSIVAGTWWQKFADEKDHRLQVSVEEDFAEDLKIKVGDRIEFNLAGSPLSAEVTSLRTVQWDSMSPNFYMIFNRPLVDQTAAANHLTSLYIPPDSKRDLDSLIRTIPTIQVIEIDQVIQQIQSIIDRVTQALQFILGLVLCAGILVMMTSIQSTLEPRLREAALIRAFGASSSFTLKMLMVEFGVLGFLAGLLAALGAEAVLFYLQQQVFNLEYSPHPMLWLTTPLAGTLLIGCTGVLSTASILKTSPLNVLRRFV